MNQTTASLALLLPCVGNWLRQFSGLRWAALLAIATALVVGTPAAALAQDGDAAAAASGEQDVQSAAATAAAGEEISLLEWSFRSLGWFFGLVFLGLSFSLVALFVMNVLAARRENVLPSELIDGFEQQLNAKQYQQAYDLAKADDSLLGHVLSAGLAKVSQGYDHAIEAMQEVGEEENMRLEHRLSYLALIGSLSPMIGLLGTVSGMISSFKTIANTAVGTPNAQELAGGVSTALFTTLVGLALAIPALAAYNLLRNRVARLVLETGIVSEGLMSRFQKPVEKTAGA
ncbi:MAG: biopolymer transporter ExbB [Planctomycetaceae bacterium]|nr:biopolymer transporter ExbB [Planctomycetaceae bacterium]